MKYSENAVGDAVIRAQHFFDDNGVALTGVVDLATARKRLDEVATSFTAHALDQDVGLRGAKGETAKQQQLRLDLRSQQMQPVAVIARRNLRTTPEFKSLQMPKSSVVGQAFLASARGMVDAATTHQAELVAHGLPSTFLDTFKATLAALEASLNSREANRGKRIGATKGLSVQEKQGRTVLSVLDALMKQALAGNEPLLRTWKVARLVRRKPGGTTTPAATPAPAPAPSAVQAADVTPLRVSESTPAAAA